MEYHVLVDKKPIFFSKSVKEALFFLLAGFYIFDIEFPKDITPSIAFLALELFNKDAGVKNLPSLQLFLNVLKNA